MNWKAFFPGTHGDHHLTTSPWIESTMFRNVSPSDVQQKVKWTVSHVHKYCVETHSITEEKCIRSGDHENLSLTKSWRYQETLKLPQLRWAGSTHSFLFLQGPWDSPWQKIILLYKWCHCPLACPSHPGFLTLPCHSHSASLSSSMCPPNTSQCPPLKLFPPQILLFSAWWL